MSELDFNPIALFKELNLFPRVIFTIGSALFAGALFYRDATLALFAVSLVCGSAGENMARDLITTDEKRGKVFTLIVAEASALVAIAMLCFYLSAYSYHTGDLPACLRPHEVVVPMPSPSQH